MLRARGFTTIELIIALLIIGVLAAVAIPYHIYTHQQAQQSVHRASGAAFATGISGARGAWLIKGAPVALAERDNLQVFGQEPDGQLDYNRHGWPVRNDRAPWPMDDPDYDHSARDDEDCASLWTTLMRGMQTQLADGTRSDTLDYIAEREIQSHGDALCRFRHRDEADYWLTYDTRSGKIEVFSGS